MAKYEIRISKEDLEEDESPEIVVEFYEYKEVSPPPQWLHWSMWRLFLHRTRMVTSTRFPARRISMVKKAMIIVTQTYSSSWPRHSRRSTSSQGPDQPMKREARIKCFPFLLPDHQVSAWIDRLFQLRIREELHALHLWIGRFWRSLVDPCAQLLGN